MQILYKFTCLYLRGKTHWVRSMKTVLQATLVSNMCQRVYRYTLQPQHNSLPANGYVRYKKEKCSVSVFRFCFMSSIIHSLFTVCSLVAWMDQFMRKRGIKFSPNDNPSLTSPEKTNGAPRRCFNITNYLGVPGKGTDVGLRMRKGWGAGQGHHTPRLGSDKHGWLGVFTCPQDIKGRHGERLKS